MSFEAQSKKMADKMLANLKVAADPKKADAIDAKKDARDAKAKPSKLIPFGEGTHEHHRDQALAHLAASRAHAEAAHSARVVDAAGEHASAVSAARDADAKVMAKSHKVAKR